ncbi:VWA domain-containing protein [Halosquirtibacter laminarini]|uniref:VWA domain-containing protein n=1 Tax=Halosquirtibacter laminarini TaxID=3374600 RepID=A0AC61NJ00_9BACT|nr:VWA domain-containing protein [Prolixibacteraceae bacterium]
MSFLIAINLNQLTFEQLHFTYPYFILLILLPWLVHWFIPAFRFKNSRLRVPFYDRVTEVLGVSSTRAKRFYARSIFRTIFLYLSYCLLVLALMQPKFIGEPILELKKARTFVVASDISMSMERKDWTLNGKMVRRWDAVKYMMSKFLQDRKSDRIGLVLFGDHAYLQCPPTDDKKMVEWLIQDAEVGMAGQKTSLGEAIGFSLGIMKQDTLKEKILLLMTDGVDTKRSISPETAAKVAALDSVKIYTLGIGSRRDTTRLNESILKNISKITGGKYFYANDTTQLKHVYDYIDQLEPLKYQKSSFAPETPLYRFPLLVAIGLLFLLLIMNGLFRSEK